VHGQLLWYHGGQAIAARAVVVSKSWAPDGFAAGALGSGLITRWISSIHLFPSSCGLLKRTLDDQRPPGKPSLFFHQHVKPVGAGAGDCPARLFFPGHFIPAPFFNVGTALVGT
jgi:hypothetical protein